MDNTRKHEKHAKYISENLKERACSKALHGYICKIQDDYLCVSVTMLYLPQIKVVFIY
jgi:hypothetical protein